jgi:general secretion pathway protein D
MKLRACLAVAVLLVGTPVVGQPQEPRTIRINYVDADLGEVIRSLAATVGLNVVLTDVPSARITFQTPAPVAESQVGAVLESILESQGLVLVQNGPVAEVMPDARRPATGPVQLGKTLPNPPPLGLITQIVPLDYMRADEAVALLKQTASKMSRIEVVSRSNSVLITDRGASVARYLDLLRQLDVKTGGEAGLRTYVYQLKHASAVELAGTLGQVFGAVVAAPAERARVQALEDRSLSSSLETFRRRDIEAYQQRAQMPPPSAAPSTEPGATGPPAAEAAARGLVGQTMIVPDQATNSLVVRTAPPNFPILQETIDGLDVRPAQVLLEVLIAEVTLDRATQYGINWQVFDAGRGITGGFGTQDFSDSALAAPQGLRLRLIHTTGVNVRAILQALSSRNNVRVLSTPHVLALNNEQARILIGSEVPFNSSLQSGINVVVAQTVEFRKVGTQLTIIPTVNKDGYVTFRILQEVSALTNQTIQAALNAPVISTREAETSAIVKSGSTVIIGGLIGDTRNVIQSGVPLLQDIPLLGGLFRNRSTTHSRTELAIFVTPHVVFNDEQADSLLELERERLPAARQSIDSALAPVLRGQHPPAP